MTSQPAEAPSFREQLRWAYRAWRYRLLVESREVRELLNCLGPGDTAIDIGAHKGAYTYWMRSRVGAAGSVVAFEPQPLLANRLKRMVAGRGFDNVRVENLGVSSSTGQRTFFFDPRAPSPGASFEPGAGESTAGAPMPVVALDDYVARHDLSQVRLIKCDVEGHELEVFRGARRLLASQKPNLLFECETRHRPGGTVEEVFDYLTSLGYSGVALGARRTLDLAEFNPDTHQRDVSGRKYVNNFFFQSEDGYDAR